ncbi:Major facilitator family transporter [Cupriavidus taiwanensis]|uniref:Major facilitator family transporter n=1 Tax=Cupriavidus taiwanensis TaxID=164546 RepID=A0A975X5U5_9BURK|nr:MFS transporter [Cupriavidus taiwanensis]SOY58535.1 Major facilitator family transporter [Cupriavidus taiwanensis]
MDRRLLILALGMFAMGTDNFVVAGILPSVAASLQTSVSVAGLMVTCYALTYAVAAPVMAAVAGGLPRKLLLVSALGIFVVGNAISALATDVNWVLMSRALAGFGAALFSPTALGVAATLAAPEKRGRALATVTAGLTGATALGSPLGTLIGGFGGWRSTLWFVTALGVAAMIGVWTLLPSVPLPAAVRLRERLAPVRDLRIALILLTSLFAFGGFLMVYTYAGVVLEPLTHGDERMLAGLFLLWGVAATAGNLLAGRLVDRFDSRHIVNAMLWIAIVNFCALPWTAAHPVSAVIALVIWGICGWGLIVPQQHRLVQLSPQMAPLLLALNNTATYLGLAGSGVLGGIALRSTGGQYLSLFAAAMIALALVLTAAAHRRIGRPALHRRAAAAQAEAL